jgi:tetratricopeptide (TPR) repeat protein
MRASFAPPVRPWPQAVLLALAVGLAAGCATVPRSPSGDSLRQLRHIPAVPEGHLRADRAILAAFFGANGIRLTGAQTEEIIAHTAPRGRMDRNALRRIAREHNRVLMVVKADELYLWEELGHNRPLLILLPPGRAFSAAATPLIPVAWDRAGRTIELLDGNGEIQSLAADDFFSRREPLKHAALCLVRPGGVRRMEPTREQKLLLADFWFHKGFYRRADAVYTAIQEADVSGTDAEALMGRGNILVRKGRYREAIPVFRAALVLEPDNPQVLNNLAYSMLKGDGELLPALRHATKADKLDPDNPLILETMGGINLRLGDAQSAARQLELAWARALKRSPEVQIAIMDQLVRAWLACDRKDLAWQVADYRHRNFPDYRFPKDLLIMFPELRRAPTPVPGALQKKVSGRD